MSYERKCLCCFRTRPQRKFFKVDNGNGSRLSLACSDCVNGVTPKKFLQNSPKPIHKPTDGLWRGPVTPGQMVASL